MRQNKTRYVIARRYDEAILGIKVNIAESLIKPRIASFLAMTWWEIILYVVYTKPSALVVRTLVAMLSSASLANDCPYDGIMSFLHWFKFSEM